jgi:hypothetical protein
VPEGRGTWPELLLPKENTWALPGEMRPAFDGSGAPPPTTHQYSRAYQRYSIDGASSIGAPRAHSRNNRVPQPIVDMCLLWYSAGAPHSGQTRSSLAVDRSCRGSPISTGPQLETPKAHLKPRPEWAARDAPAAAPAGTRRIEIPSWNHGH